MSGLKLQHFLLGVKTLASFSIIILVILPTKIHRRNEIPTLSNLTETNFTHVQHYGHHLICTMPRYDDVESVLEEESLQKLDLPHGTVVDQRLKYFARCRVIKEKSNEDIDDCSCRGRQAYFLLLVAAFVSKFLDFMRFCISHFINRFQNDDDDGNKSHTAESFTHDCFVSFGAVKWLMVGIGTAVLHHRWEDEVWFPNSLYGKKFFERPPTWSAAVALTFVCSLCAFAELVYLQKQRSKKAMKQVSEKIGDEKGTTLDHSTQNLEEPPFDDPGARKRFWRSVEKRMIRTWP